MKIKPSQHGYPVDLGDGGRKNEELIEKVTSSRGSGLSRGTWVTARLNLTSKYTLSPQS